MGVSLQTRSGRNNLLIAFAAGIMFFGAASAQWAIEIHRILPASVAACSEESPTHPAALAIDGNPETYTCLRDASPNGTGETTKPPKGDAPVTGYILFDLGGEYDLCGIYVKAPIQNCYLPKRFDIFALQPGQTPKSLALPESLSGSAESEYPAGIKILEQNATFEHFCDGAERSRYFEPVTARYIGLRFHEAHDTGRGDFYIIQFAEIAFWGNATQSEPTDAISNWLIPGAGCLADLLDDQRFVEHRNERPYPVSRLKQEWLRNDMGSFDTKLAFISTVSNNIETKLIQKVLDDLTALGGDAEEIAGETATFTTLRDGNAPGCDPRWITLYDRLARRRRQERLAGVESFSSDYIFVKHCQLVNQPSFASSAFLSDSVYKDRLGDWRMGSELCRLRIGKDGTVTETLLLQEKEGIIRDPALSFDGKKIIFSMRRSEEGDDYHLYDYDLATGQTTQLTFGLGTADIEPCPLPDGDIIFASTRCDECVPCWSSDVTNLYRCDASGRYIRRLTIDQAHNVGPKLTNDGRIIYTRWEYNDRVSGMVHKLFVMNPDGTAQTEYYGNQSFSPRSIIHPSPIPGSTKMMVIGSGHHTDQSGKLMRMDRSRGTQENEGLEYVAPVAYFEPVHDDLFGQEGELFQFPLPMSEEEYLVSYVPEGGPARGFYPVPFGIYWFDSAGHRELLVYDPTISSGQIIPLAPRQAPPIRPEQFDLSKEGGTFYVQDIYFGPGLEGVERGTVKTLRVIGLSIRAMSAGVAYNQPSSQVHTPISVGNGSWDVKHVLGDVSIEEDGSAYFKVPSRMAVYFQLLDEEGKMIQTMRSWAMVMPGEMFSCIGCHEDKNMTFTENRPQTIAISKPPQEIRPFFEPGEIAEPEFTKRLTPEERAARDYLNINAPQGEDVPQGFSYLREIQPIWDAHCVNCHNGRVKGENQSSLSLLGDTKDYGWKECWEGVASRPWSKQNIYPQNGKDMNPGRDFAESYLNLTNYGKVCYEHKPTWVDWLPMAVAFPPAVGPNEWGSRKSRIFDYLTPDHYGVTLTAKELERIACWIDLCVPYCGSYMEANHWDKIEHTYIQSYRTQCRAAYLFQEYKRLAHGQEEVDHLTKYEEHRQYGTDFAPDAFERFTAGGMDHQKSFIDAYYSRCRTVPIYGIADGLDARGGTNQPNEYRNLALHPNAETFSVTSYPRAVSNSHYKYLPEYSPSAVIDGVKGSDTASYWRPNRRTDLTLTVELGRPVETDKVVIALHNPREGRTWKSAVLEFSNGARIPIQFSQREGEQTFTFPKQTTDYLRLTNIEQDFPLTDNGIDEIEIWGKDRF